MNRWIIIGAVVVIAIVMLRRRGVPDSDIDLATATDADVDRLIRAGRKVDAIKVYRYLHGSDLKDAKQAVEARAKTLPPQ